MHRPYCVQNTRICRIQRVPGRAGSGVQGESSRAIDRTSARRRPPCRSCGDEGDGRHTALRGLDGITVSEGDGRGERARSRRSARTGRLSALLPDQAQNGVICAWASDCPRVQVEADGQAAANRRQRDDRPHGAAEESGTARLPGAFPRLGPRSSGNSGAVQ